MISILGSLLAAKLTDMCCVLSSVKVAEDMDVEVTADQQLPVHVRRHYLLVDTGPTPEEFFGITPYEEKRGWWPTRTLEQ